MFANTRPMPNDFNLVIGPENSRTRFPVSGMLFASCSPVIYTFILKYDWMNRKEYPLPPQIDSFSIAELVNTLSKGEIDQGLDFDVLLDLLLLADFLLIDKLKEAVILIIIRNLSLTDVLTAYNFGIHIANQVSEEAYNFIRKHITDCVDDLSHAPGCFWKRLLQEEYLLIEESHLLSSLLRWHERTGDTETFTQLCRGIRSKGLSSPEMGRGLQLDNKSKRRRIRRPATSLELDITLAALVPEDIVMLSGRFIGDFFVSCHQIEIIGKGAIIKGSLIVHGNENYVKGVKIYHKETGVCVFGSQNRIRQCNFEPMQPRAFDTCGIYVNGSRNELSEIFVEMCTRGLELIGSKNGLDTIEFRNCQSGLILKGNCNVITVLDLVTVEKGVVIEGSDNFVERTWVCQEEGEYDEFEDIEIFKISGSMNKISGVEVREMDCEDTLIRTTSASIHTEIDLIRDGGDIYLEGRNVNMTRIHIQGEVFLNGTGHKLENCQAFALTDESTGSSVLNSSFGN